MAEEKDEFDSLDDLLDDISLDDDIEDEFDDLLDDFSSAELSPTFGIIGSRVHFNGNSQRAGVSCYTYLRCSCYVKPKRKDSFCIWSSQ